MPITPLPDPPLRSDSAEVFVEKADTFMAALPAFAVEANSVENALLTSTVTATSTTSLTIGTGSKSLTTQTGKAWIAGSWLYIVSSSSITNTMQGQVTAYNSGTGSLTVNVTSVSGAGTFASWAIGLSVVDAKLGNAVDMWHADSAGYSRVYFGYGGTTSLQGYGAGIILKVLDVASEVAFKVLADGSVYSGLEAYTKEGLPQLGQLQSGAHISGTAGGTVDALTLTTTPLFVPGMLVDGTRVLVQALGANTSASPTLAVGTTGVGYICKGTNNALLPGDIPGAEYWCDFVFDSSLGKWVLQNPAKGVNPQIVGGTTGAIPYQTGPSATGLSAVGAAGQFLQSTGGGAPVFASPPSVTGAFKNLNLSTTGTSAPVTVTADEIVVSDGAGYYKTLSAVSLSVAGTSVGVANGLDAGSLATNQWYSVWVIWNGGTTAGLLSTSDTAPTPPSGYTFKARVGWMKTDGTGNKYPLGFTQRGRCAAYKVASGTNLTTPVVISAGVQGSISTPTFVSVSVLGESVPVTASSANVSASSTSQTIGVAPTSSFGASGSVTAKPPILCSFASSTANTSGTILLSGANLYVYSDHADNRAFIHGWEDNL